MCSLADPKFIFTDVNWLPGSAISGYSRQPVLYFFVELLLSCERLQIKIVVVVDNTDSVVNKGHNVCVLVYRDRVSALWSTVRDHLSNILVNAAQHRYELYNN